MSRDIVSDKLSFARCCAQMIYQLPFCDLSTNLIVEISRQQSKCELRLHIKNVKNYKFKMDIRTYSKNGTVSIQRNSFESETFSSFSDDWDTDSVADEDIEIRITKSRTKTSTYLVQLFLPVHRSEKNNVDLEQKQCPLSFCFLNPSIMLILLKTENRHNCLDFFATR